MFTKNLKLNGIEEILTDIGYLEEMKGAGEDQEHKYTKKSGKKSRDYDRDGDVEDETDEYAGVKDRAIKKATGKCSKCGKEPCECDDVKEGCGSTHGKKKKSEKEVNEKIDVGADAGATISDFVRSKDPRFSGDTKKQRIKRALGAYYGDKKEEVEYMDEAGKLQGGGKDPCWKGYEMVGMKKKGGREVPNCVPKEEYTELYFDMLEEGYTLDQVREVLAAYEDGFEVIFEEDGVTINETQEVLDEETEFLSDVEMVADWLYAEGIIEDEDQFFELMEDLSEEEIEELYDVVAEATAMAKRGHDETKLRQRAGGGAAADRATALEKKPTYGDSNKAQQRQNYARAQRGDFRNTASSNPGLHVGGHKSNDPAVKAKQAARGAQRGALTPKERKDLNMGYEMIGNSLEEGGLEVRTIHEISADLALRASKAADQKRAQLARAGDKEGAAAKAAQASRLYNKQAAKRLGRKEQVEMIGNSLEEGGLEVRNYSHDEVMESQYARNNPEKYEAEQKKKTPKGAMPPRGDKRREDFERWYAANVR
jgi:hypothetical protein